MGGGRVTQTSTVDPFSGEYKSWVAPVKDKVFSAFQNPAAGYTGQLNYPTTGNQQYAFSGFRQAADNQMLQDTIAGKYLTPESNPYIQKTYDMAAQSTMKDLNKMYDNLNSQFARGGVYNSSARYNALRGATDQAGEILGNMATKLYGDNYNQERGYQLQGLSAQQQLLGNLLNAGNVEQQIGQQGLDRDYREWLRQMGVNDSNLDRAINFLQTVKSPQETQTQTKTSIGK